MPRRKKMLPPKDPQRCQVYQALIYNNVHLIITWYVEVSVLTLPVPNFNTDKKDIIESHTKNTKKKLQIGVLNLFGQWTLWLSFSPLLFHIRICIAINKVGSGSS